MRKLIRNKIPELIMGERKSLVNEYHQGIRKMSGWEYEYALRLKMYEEWSEAWESPCPEEFGDCLQVLKDAAELMGIPWSQVVTSQEEKKEVRGSFNQMWELSTK